MKTSKTGGDRMMQHKLYRGIFGVLFGIILGCLTGCAAVDKALSMAESDVQVHASAKESSSAEASSSSSTKPDRTTSAAASTEPEHSVSGATWHASTQEHKPSVDYMIQYEDGFLYNFNDLVATGWCSNTEVWKETELEYGIIVSVLDGDSVNVHPYNYSKEHLRVISVTAERSTGDYRNKRNIADYIIDGYAECENGAGVIAVE